MSELAIHTLTPAESALTKSVVALADANRRTLGFLPEQAILERIRSGHAVVATHEDKLAGYALFDLPRDEIRLIHLCVAPRNRGEGIARSLVQALAARYPSRRGILVRCRRDWPANGLWPTLGFAPRRDVPGRGKDRKPLTVWWLDFGLPDLFSGSEEVDKLVVAMDTNVFTDLHSEQSRIGREESEILRAPWIDAEIELVVTAALINELDRTDDATLRQKLVGAANDYRLLRSKPEESNALTTALLASVEPSLLAGDESLVEDARLVAASGAGGADVYLTRDGSAIDALASRAADKLGIQMLRPSDLAIHLDQIRDSSRLAELRLHESRITIHTWPVGAANRLADLINTEAGETRAGFNARIRRIASASASAVSRLLLDDDGHASAALATADVDHVLDVALARVAKGQAFTKAIAGQMPLLIRREAVGLGATNIRISDPHSQRLVVDALLQDGFQVGPGGQLSAVTIDRVLSFDDLESLLASVNPQMDLDSDWAALEHALWPLKINDADATCYLIPIKPDFASRLFGSDLTLLDRDPQLALAREHVYYHAPRRRLSAPSRILWYVSSPDKEVVGCSQAVSVHVDTPEILHERFRHLGVWDFAAVRSSAKGGRVAAVRFRDTQLFTTRVSLGTLRRMAPDGALAPLQSARQISESRFMSVYHDGRRTP